MAHQRIPTHGHDQIRYGHSRIRKLQGLAAQGQTVGPKTTGMLLAEGGIIVLGAKQISEPAGDAQPKMPSLAAEHIGQGAGTMGLQNSPLAFRQSLQWPGPKKSFQICPGPLQWMGQTVGVVLMEGDVQTFSAGISLTSGVVLVRSGFDNTIIFHQDLKAAINAAKGTACFMSRFHEILR